MQTSASGRRVVKYALARADVHELGFSHAKFIGRIGALLCALIAVGGTASVASPVAPATYGPTRAWGGTEIRSLDPAPLASAASNSVASTRPKRRPDQVLSNETT